MLWLSDGLMVSDSVEDKGEVDEVELSVVSRGVQVFE